MPNNFQMCQELKWSVKAKQYQAQLGAAARDIKRIEQSMRDSGWQWDDDLKQWYHPDAPGTIVSY
jgi:hypothetical protein